jgi:hypothetical protein
MSRAKRVLKKTMWAVVIDGSAGDTFVAWYGGCDGLPQHAIFALQTDAAKARRLRELAQFRPRLARVRVTELPPARAGKGKGK